MPDQPVANYSNAELLTGMSLAMTLLVGQVSKTDPELPNRLATQIDEVLQVLAAKDTLEGELAPLLLLRRTLDGVRPYEDVEEMVRLVRKRK